MFLVYYNLNYFTTKGVKINTAPPFWYDHCNMCLNVTFPAGSMAHADSKLIVIGTLAGVAGVSLAAIWYHSLKSRRRDSWPGVYHNSPGGGGGGGGGVTVENGRSLVVPALADQAEVLDRLEALIRCVSELKDEMRALKSALPLLPDQVREELKNGRSEGGAAPGSRRTTPTRRKRAAATGLAARSGGQSSEEAESEGG